MTDKGFDIDVWDLGNVHENTKHKFVFKYLGDKNIRNTSTSCGCTSAKNDDGEITGTINTNAGSDFHAYKHLNKTVTVNFMDRTSTTLRITGKVYKKNVDLNKIKEDATTTA